MTTLPEKPVSVKSRPIWRQPLVHFLLAASAIFVIDEVRGGETRPDRGLIVVTDAQIDRMSAMWEQSWDRPPARHELETILADHIEEEVYNREARALGLDTDDPVIRRYIRQKMELLTQGSIVVPEPGHGELQAFFEANASNYQSSPRFDFQQIYLGPELTVDPASQLTAVRSGLKLENLPDQTRIASQINDADKVQISRIYGSSFYDALASQSIAEWQGPVASVLGYHFVKISRREPGITAPFSDVSEAVLADWHAAKRLELERAAFERLKAQYEIRLELPTE
jgi:hypothetical protein